MAEVGLRLDTLAARINAEHAEVQKAVDSALTHAIEAGRLLEEAKAGVRHSEWGPWLERNFAGSDRTARAYMQLWRNREQLEAKRQRVAEMSVRGALRELAAPRSSSAEGGGAVGLRTGPYSAGGRARA